MSLETLFLTQQPFREGLLERTGLFSSLTEVSKTFYGFRLQAKSLYFKPSLGTSHSIFTRYTHLKHLEISSGDRQSTLLTGEALKHLPGLHTLLWSVPAIDLRSVSLIHFTAMKRLSLSCEDERAFAALPLTLPSSTSLQSIHYDGFQHIPCENPDQLTELAIRFQKMGGFRSMSGYPTVAPLTRLQSLYINDSILATAERFLPAISRLTNLEYLRCRVRDLSNANFSCLSSLQQLKHLDFGVDNFVQTVEKLDAACFQHFTRLKILWLTNIFFDQKLIHNLYSLRDLEDLRCNDPTLGNNMAKHCSNFPRLRFLYLGEAPGYSDADIPLLCAACPSITDLMIMGASLSDATVETLSRNLPGLRSLDLSHTLIGADAKDAFAKLTNLQFIHLSETDATDDTVSELTHLFHSPYDIKCWYSENWDPAMVTHQESLAPDFDDLYWWTTLL